MAPAQRRAPSPLLPPDLPSQCTAKCARTHHELASVPAHSSNLSSTGEMVGPHRDHDASDSQQPPGHHDGRSTSAGVSSGQSPSSTTTTSPLHQTGRSPMAVVTSPCMQHSLMLLKRETHEIRLKIRQKEMEGKGMAKCYPCQVQNYQAWFEQEQSQIAANDPSRVVLPVFPVTAAITSPLAKRYVQPG
jgi:hypothetical protein